MTLASNQQNYWLISFGLAIIEGGKRRNCQRFVWLGEMRRDFAHQITNATNNHAKKSLHWYLCVWRCWISIADAFIDFMMIHFCGFLFLSTRNRRCAVCILCDIVHSNVCIFVYLRYRLHWKHCFHPYKVHILISCLRLISNLWRKSRLQSLTECAPALSSRRLASTNTVNHLAVKRFVIDSGMSKYSHFIFMTQVFSRCVCVCAKIL